MGLLDSVTSKIDEERKDRIIPGAKNAQSFAFTISTSSQGISEKKVLSTE